MEASFIEKVENYFLISSVEIGQSNAQKINHKKVRDNKLKKLICVLRGKDNL